MTDPQLQELADLWQQPDGSEQEAFERMARKARRRGKLLAYADLALAVLLLGGSLLAVVMEPTPFMMAVAIAILFLTVVVTWQRRSIRQVTRTLVTTDRAGFLASSLRNARANLRGNTLNLIFFPGFIAAGATFKVALRHQGRLEHPLEALLAWTISPRGMISLTLMALIAAAMVRTRRKIRLEIQRLEELRLAYEEVAAQEEEAGIFPPPSP